MKNLLFTLAATAMLGVSTTFMPASANALATYHEKALTCQFDQCHAIAKSTGKRCKHCVSNSGDYYCWQHK